MMSKQTPTTRRSTSDPTRCPERSAWHRVSRWGIPLGLALVLGPMILRATPQAEERAGVLTAETLCNGVDDDADGAIDEGAKTLFYRDQDLDTYGVEGNTLEACEAPFRYAIRPGDCNDLDGSTNPSRTQDACDGRDNDCDKTCDEDHALEVLPGWSACGSRTDQAPDVNADCDRDICDGIDNEGNGIIDDAFDLDDDGYTKACLNGKAYYTGASGSRAACDEAPGEETETPTAPTPAPEGCAVPFPDCDDLDPDTVPSDLPFSPGSVDLCEDGIDNDCDTRHAEDYDRDGDGYTTCGADPRTGSLADEDVDCLDDPENPGSPSVHPRGPELCDGLDNDCDGRCDEDFDRDGDGYAGNCAVQTDVWADLPGRQCAAAPALDCADNPESPGAGEIFPGAPEYCDTALDEDCDGEIDEGECTATPPPTPTVTPTAETSTPTGDTSSYAFCDEVDEGCGCTRACYVEETGHYGLLDRDDQCIPCIPQEDRGRKGERATRGGMLLLALMALTARRRSASRAKRSGPGPIQAS